jgi:hypothetical protein
MPAILATWKAEMRKIRVHVQPRQNVLKTPSKPIKNWAWFLPSSLKTIWET